MKTTEFVIKLKKLRPDAQILRGFDFDEDFINEYRNSFDILKLKESNDTLDPILSLIREYNVSNVDIGLVRFNNENEVLENNRYIYIGNFDADYLAIDKYTNEIIVLSCEDPDHVLVKCSKDSFSFLSALYEVARINNELFLGNISSNDKNIKELAESIAKVSGGDEYLDFYLLILGYEGE
ncbi:hypothetical protein [uncultured Psychroserpens sp.]|uniref:hypothetical protein n=1 Tax=uncultured Psychroserpens sp. TaxID=255436 RepID=UPI00260D9739|nr:hypothetical protein [uncultured Psychroserpens sp.]